MIPLTDTTKKKMKHVKPQMSLYELNIFGSYGACVASTEQCEPDEVWGIEAFTFFQHKTWCSQHN